EYLKYIWNSRKDKKVDYSVADFVIKGFRYVAAKVRQQMAQEKKQLLEVDPTKENLLKRLLLKDVKVSQKGFFLGEVERKKTRLLTRKRLQRLAERDIIDYMGKNLSEAMKISVPSDKTYRAQVDFLFLKNNYLSSQVEEDVDKLSLAKF